MGDGGKRVDRKGLDGGRDRTAGFMILVKTRVSYFNEEVCLILIQKQCLLHYLK